MTAEHSRVSVWFSERRRKMDPLLHTKYQGMVEIVDFTRRTCSEKVKDCPIDWKGDDHRFLGFRWEEGETVTELCCAEFLSLFGSDWQKKRPHFMKKKVHFHYDRASSLISAVVTTKLVDLRYGLLSHPLNSPDPVQFLFVSKLEKVARWVEILVIWGEMRLSLLWRLTFQTFKRGARGARGKRGKRVT